MQIGCSTCSVIFERDGHTVHTLIQQHLPPPLASTEKSLFTRAHSSPQSLAARLHRSHANRSHYINNGWTFSIHTLYGSHILNYRFVANIFI